MRRFFSATIILGLAMLPQNVFALTPAQNDAITTGCNSIKQTLKTIQSADSRSRVFLGGHYEVVLSNFMINLNKRLIGNNIPSNDLSNNQATFASAKATFASDFIAYQKSLEEAINIDCVKSPVEFYDKLNDARAKRQIVNEDALKANTLIPAHIELVNQLKGAL